MEAAVLLLLALLLGRGGEAWIESLYRSQMDVLRYPAAVKGHFFGRLLLLSGGFWGAGLVLSGLPLTLAELAARLVLVWFLLLTICTDWEQHVVFDRMIFPLALLVLPFFPLLGWPVWNHVFAALAGGGIFFLLAVLTKGGIGGGDIKLVFVLGLWLGTGKLFSVLVWGCLFSGAVAAVMLLAGIWKRNEYYAYSPYFSLVAIGMLLFGS